VRGIGNAQESAMLRTAHLSFRFPRSVSLVACAAVLGAASAAAAVQAPASPPNAGGSVAVTYTEPQKFADIGRGAFDQERTLAGLTQWFEGLGAELPAGQSLHLTVTDVDLAGTLMPNRRGEDLRVLRGQADWPQISLHYELREGSRVVKSGDARISDLNYLYSLRGRDTGGPLAYEKNMLRKWFNENFALH
jgi:hypothetical protein